MTIYLNIIFFVLTFLCVTLWLQLRLFFSSLGHAKSKEEALSDLKLLTLIKSKTGYQLEKIFIVDSKQLFGMMPSVFKPHLILSKALYENFDTDETEYVLLHEMAHFLLHHVIKEEIIGLLLLVTGFTAISALSLPILPSILLGLLFGITMIRLGRLDEYEADTYSLSRMTNPQGMISATHKFQVQYGSPKNKIMELLFHRGNPFANRIRMAQVELSKRQK